MSHVVRLKECTIDPGECTGRVQRGRTLGQQLAACTRWPNSVIDTSQLDLRGVNYPLGEVAHIYELNSILRRSRRKHFASTGEPCRPISEPTRRILWPDNKARPANEGVFTHGLLARDFGSTIGFITTILDL